MPWDLGCEPPDQFMQPGDPHDALRHAGLGKPPPRLVLNLGVMMIPSPIIHDDRENLFRRRVSLIAGLRGPIGQAPSGTESVPSVGAIGRTAEPRVRQPGSPTPHASPPSFELGCP